MLLSPQYYINLSMSTLLLSIALSVSFLTRYIVPCNSFSIALRGFTTNRGISISHDRLYYNNINNNQHYRDNTMRRIVVSTPTLLSSSLPSSVSNLEESQSTSRRLWVQNQCKKVFVLSTVTSMSVPSSSFATDDIEEVNEISTATTTTAISTKNAEITTKAYIKLKGIPPASSSDPTIPSNNTNDDIITIGLFGKNAPECTKIITQLLQKPQKGGGYSAKCKPLVIKTLQKEQLEANKVYNTCIADTESGSGTSGLVTYESSQVWRVIQDERIDLGAISGKFISREYPTFMENTNNDNVGDYMNSLKHDDYGVISVRRGNEGGFGFTIYTGNGTSNDSSKVELDENHIVIGKVLDGMDVIRRLNEIPVVQSALASGSNVKRRNAPSRSCRYGGSELYCSEYKPLRKVIILESDVILE